MFNAISKYTGWNRESIQDELQMGILDKEVQKDIIQACYFKNNII